jgi:hypothetical protein
LQEQKKELNIKIAKDNAITSRASLDLKLLPEEESDRQLAGMMKFHCTRSIEENSKRKLNEILSKPLFSDEIATIKKHSKTDIVKITSLGIVRKGEEDTNPPSKKAKLLCDYSSSSSDENS